MTNRKISARLSEDRLARLDALAAATGRSRSWLIGRALEQYLDYESWAVGEIRAGIESAKREPLVAHEAAVDSAHRGIAEAKARRRN